MLLGLKLWLILQSVAFDVLALYLATSVKVFEKPPEKGPVKLVDSNDVDGLIELLQNEAKVL